jgi:hypothetical protein
VSQLDAAAALTAGLLARKGAATPATLAPRQPVFAAGLDAPTVPFGKAAPFPAPERRASESAHAAHRQRLTLRLDDRRHLHLRLMSAHFALSRQELIVRALDEFLERHAAGTSAEHCRCLHVADGTNGADDDGRACCAER